ncbi:MAG: tetratricopeptide repeat protein [candidate division Zixibacteria bacterium]|nr:tetratricopeptide repeat protein [candidate division Zixibacteria bacterium]
MSRKVWLGLLPIAALLLYQFFSFDVLQDDAFISFRYIRNFLDGFGLVFNLGERVEGYTNFLWIILLSVLTKLGLPLIESARSVGILAGVGTILLAAYAAHRLYPKRNWVWILSVPMLLAANGALAYWAGSGLETGLFTFLAAAAAVTYFSRPALSLLLLALATLTRPEGALLAFLFGASGILIKQKSWKATLTFWGGLALLLLPFAVFKWLYYGSLFPNPFYAKTGFSTEYWKSGVEYSFMFLKHYGLSGAALLLPLMFWKKLTVFSRFSLLIFFGYGVYLTAIGGDVLKAHRFFLPALFFLYFPLADCAHRFLENQTYRVPVFSLALLVIAFFSYKIPLSYLKTSARWEKELVGKMTNAGRFFAQSEGTKSVAASTIGALSYYIGSQRRIIDMIGLTDPVIARTPEKIEGLVASWKERHFNAGYVLSQKPEVILFSTGYKPSAPAERALFLYPDFRQNYRMELYFYAGSSDAYFRRFRNLPLSSTPDQSIGFVTLVNQALNRGQDKRVGIRLLRKALAEGPPDCETIYTMLGYYYFSTGEPGRAEVCFNKAIELNGGGSISRYYYRNFLSYEGRYAEMEEQDSIILRTVPNFKEFLQTPGASQ